MNSVDVKNINTFYTIQHEYIKNIYIDHLVLHKRTTTTRTEGKKNSPSKNMCIINSLWLNMILISTRFKNQRPIITTRR